jgi:hypothetical protein
MALTACSSPNHGPPAETAVIVGVQSEPMSGAIDSLQIVTTLGGATNTDRTMSVSGLPYEVTVVPPPGRTNTVVGVEVYGFRGSAGPKPLLRRTATTTFVPGQIRLLRLLLQGRCLAGLPGGPPGAPSCGMGQTCIDGSCQSDSVDPRTLEVYSHDWATNTPDICKPVGAGPAVVQVGTGQSDYLPLTYGQTIQAEQGPQGGHHIWIALRQKNLKRSGSTTTIESVQPSTGIVGPKTAFVFTFDQGEGGFCKLSGLRYQLDVEGTDYHKFLGHPLDLTVTIADPSGSKASGAAHIDIAPSLLCPSGTPGC